MATYPKTVALVANGVIHNFEATAKLVRAYDYIIAVDGGLHHCDRMGIRPDLIIGDMDSVSSEVLEQYSDVPTKRFPREKDETDMELALQTVVLPESEKITIFGALEKRTDHALYNLHLIRRYPRKVFIESETEVIFALEHPAELKCSVGQELSLIPLGTPATGVKTEGLKWELNGVTLNKNFMSISNICLQNPVKVSLETGALLCRFSKVGISDV